MAPVASGRLPSRFVTFYPLLSPLIASYQPPPLTCHLSAPPTCHLLSAVPVTLHHWLARCLPGPCHSAGWRPCPRCPPRARRRSRRCRWTRLTRRARTGEGVPGVTSSRAQGRFWDPLLQPRRGEKGFLVSPTLDPAGTGTPRGGGAGRCPSRGCGTRCPRSRWPGTVPRARCPRSPRPQVRTGAAGGLGRGAAGGGTLPRSDGCLQSLGTLLRVTRAIPCGTGAPNGAAPACWGAPCPAPSCPE